MKKTTTVLSFLWIGLASIAQVSEQSVTTQDKGETTIEKQLKYSRARIHYNGNKNLMLLGNQGVVIDHGKHKLGTYIESDFSEVEIGKARMLGMKVDILIDDVQEYYVEQNKGAGKASTVQKNANCNGSSGTPSYPTPANYNHGSMGGFLTYSEMLQELDDMAAAYPNLITVKSGISTFQTHEGRPIYWVRMSDNANTDEAEPEVLYTAIHHAREPASMQQLIYYMWYMLENYATNTEVQAILDNTELYFIPVINPDGYLRNETTNPNGGGMWRKNRRNHGNGDYGVDNNRNYDYIDGSGNSVWGTSGVTMNTGADDYPGTGPFTEPENLAIKWFVENHDIKLALNNHTYADLLLYPFGYATNTYTTDNATYEAIAPMMTSQSSMAPQISAALYPAAGDSDDFMYGETSTHNKIFAFTPEIGGNQHGFWPSVNDIDPLCESMVHTNLTAAHLVTNYGVATDLTPLVLEDLNGYFHYDIQRLGLEDPANFTVSIVPITTNITSVGSPNSHSNMALLQQDQDSISYTLDPGIAPGDGITYVISLDNGQYVTNDTVNKIYGQGQLVLADPANNLNNWDVSQTWGTTASTYYSPATSITDSPNGNYSNNINKTITLTNNVDLSTAIAATMSFYAKWYIEDNYDYVQVEVSTNGGSSWIPQCGNYTNPGVSDQELGEPLYDGVQNTWVKEEIDLSDYIGESILVRFQIVSDGGVRDDGFFFDDFEINAVYGPDGIAEMTENGMYISQNIPNPSNESTIINYVLPQGMNQASLKITNEMGQIVDVINLGANSQKVEVSTVGLSQGVYYYYLEGEDTRSATMKMIVVR